MVIEEVGLEAEEVAHLVVDLAGDDGTVGPLQRGQTRDGGVEPHRALLVELRRRVGRRREEVGAAADDHRRAQRGARHHALVPEHAERVAEVGQLGVDVRPGPDQHLEAALAGHAHEALDVALSGEVELAARRLVDRPGHVGLDHLEAEGAHRVEHVAPAFRVEPPVVDGARDQWHNLGAHPQSPPRNHADARLIDSRAHRSLPSCGLQPVWQDC
jgi:hypothetical protein